MGARGSSLSVISVWYCNDRSQVLNTNKYPFQRNVAHHSAKYTYYIVFCSESDQSLERRPLSFNVLLGSSVHTIDFINNFPEHWVRCLWSLSGVAVRIDFMKLCVIEALRLGLHRAWIKSKGNRFIIMDMDCEILSVSPHSHVVLDDGKIKRSVFIEPYFDDKALCVTTRRGFKNYIRNYATVVDTCRAKRWSLPVFDVHDIVQRVAAEPEFVQRTKLLNIYVKYVTHGYRSYENFVFPDRLCELNYVHTVELDYELGLSWYSSVTKDEEFFFKNSDRPVYFRDIVGLWMSVASADVHEVTRRLRRLTSSFDVVRYSTSTSCNPFNLSNMNFMGPLKTYSDIIDESTSRLLITDAYVSRQMGQV